METTADQRLREHRRKLFGALRAAQFCEDLDIAADALALLRKLREDEAELHVVWVEQIDALLTRAGRA